MLKIRFYTLAQYPQEEAWLQREAARGNLIERITIPCFYFFRKGKPQKIAYRYDFEDSYSSREECIALYKEYGWRLIGSINHFLLFSHPIREGQPMPELFSNAESRDEMISRILQRRMIPLFCLFGLMCLISIMMVMRHAAADSVFLITGCTMAVGLMDFACLAGLLKIRSRLRSGS